MGTSDQDAIPEPMPGKGQVGFVPGTVDEFINWVLSITEDFPRRSFPSPDEWARIIGKLENEPPGWAHVLPPRETRETRGTSEIVTLTWAAERITRSPAGDLIVTPLGDLMQIKATPVPTARVQIDEFIWTEHIHYGGGIIRYLLHEELLPQIYELPGFVLRIVHTKVVETPDGRAYVKHEYGPGKTQYIPVTGGQVIAPEASGSASVEPTAADAAPVAPQLTPPPLQRTLFRWDEDNWAIDQIIAGRNREEVYREWVERRRKNKARDFEDIPAILRNSFSQILSRAKKAGYDKL